jgi:hypothetical protein
MKNPLFVLCASFALASPFATFATPSAEAWLETYYVNPRPEQFVDSFRALSREGYFDRPGNVPVAVGFFSAVLAQNPDRVEGWLAELKGLPLRHQRLLAASLWQAGHPRGAELMRKLAASSPMQAEIERLASLESRRVLDTAVLSPASMNLQWGAYLATGDERHIVNIFDAIGHNEPGLEEAATVALAQHAADHPQVMEICRTQLDRQPDEVKEVLRAAVNAGSKARPSS